MSLGSDNQEVRALIQFLKAWKDLLNRGTEKDRLTEAELYCVTEWSKRMMKMGAADTHVSVLEDFADQCEKALKREQKTEATQLYCIYFVLYSFSPAFR